MQSGTQSNPKCDRAAFDPPFRCPLDSRIIDHGRNRPVSQDSMPETIHITLPDGSKRELPKGATPLDVAKSISPRLADAALVAKIKPPSATKDGGQFADLTKPLDQDAELRCLPDPDAEALAVVRHSSAHVLATAVLALFPETKLGHGPPTDSR